MRDALKEIVGTVDRVRAVDYSVPARVRLLEALNERLMTITDLNPLGDLSAVGLAVVDWLAAIELRRSILAELIRIDPGERTRALKHLRAGRKNLRHNFRSAVAQLEAWLEQYRSERSKRWTTDPNAPPASGM